MLRYFCTQHCHAVRTLYLQHDFQRDKGENKKNIVWKPASDAMQREPSLTAKASISETHLHDGFQGIHWYQRYPEGAGKHASSGRLDRHRKVDVS